ncbi:MAG: ATP-binding protein [Dissulfurispiraceae bacterium]|jgi:signal transduction histidine kinase
MAKSFSDKQELKAFINAAQYLAGLTSGQDVWEEAGKVLVKFFGADLAAFGRHHANGAIELDHWSFSERGASARLPEKEMLAAVGDVFESSFLTFISFQPDDPIAAAFFPILHENHVIAVMLVGHLSATHLENETLDLYLAVAGLIGATYSRKISLVHLEGLVEERTAELTAVNQELERFSYSVSHDLRAPLRHISGFVELLRQRLVDYPDVKAQDYMYMISEASKKMSMLIDDLLNFSRLGHAQMQKTKVNLHALVKAVVQEIHEEQKERKIRWEIDEMPDVLGDQSLLRLVLVNLVSNAVKFTSTRPQAEIRIGCKDDGDKFTFFITDNGVGFDMKFVNKLFGVFQRLHSQNEFEGTGIGLANIQRIISRHGGRVWAEGAVEKGATFYFTLPKIKET